MTKRQWLKESGSWSVLSGLGDEAYDFYYMAMHDNGMHLYDADEYAWLNTLIGYDIGADKAKAIIRWLYENDQSAMGFEAGDIRTLKNICEMELGLQIDFSNAVTETPNAIKYTW